MSLEALSSPPFSHLDILSLHHLERGRDQIIDECKSASLRGRGVSPHQSCFHAILTRIRDAIGELKRKQTKEHTEKGKHKHKNVNRFSSRSSSPSRQTDSNQKHNRRAGEEKRNNKDAHTNAKPCKDSSMLLRGRMVGSSQGLFHAI